MPIEKTYIDPTLSYKQLMQKYNLERSLAFVVKKRGYTIKRTKLVNISEKDFDYNEAKKAAKYIFFKKVRYMFSNSLAMFDELQQVAIIRCFELSGESKKNKKFNHYCKISEYAMYSFLEKEHILGPLKGRILSFEEKVLGKGIYETASSNDT